MSDGTPGARSVARQALFSACLSEAMYVAGRTQKRSHFSHRKGGDGECSIVRRLNGHNRQWFEVRTSELRPPQWHFDGRGSKTSGGICEGVVGQFIVAGHAIGGVVPEQDDNQMVDRT